MLPLLLSGACASKHDAANIATGGLGARGDAGAPGGRAGMTGNVGGAGAGGVSGSGAAGTGGAEAGRNGAAGNAMAGVGGAIAGNAGTTLGGAAGTGTAGIGAAGATMGAGMGGRTNTAGTGNTAGTAGAPPAPTTLTLIPETTFYDGYATLSPDPVPTGVQRLRNDLLTHKLTDTELASIQNTLHVEVVIGALCDNYDRIGSVALAFVPKGQTKYKPEDVDRIEVGRYITPFLDFNKQPDEVSYHYDVDQLVPVLHDPELRAEFDLWFELELFGVPYAANDEIAGCANRSDVFRGTLKLTSDSSKPAPVFDELVPLTYKAEFNDYQRGASDTTGKTRKTLPFTLAADAADAQLVLITSNHGANSGGEEYSRRDHFVYVDDELKLMYKPGRMSCEPFRKVNTQSNGIYGTSARSNSDWQSFSNWCPGDVIDTRVIPLGALTAGAHEFVIEVPDAVFMGDEGNIPLSLYLQYRRN